MTTFQNFIAGAWVAATAAGASGTLSVSVVGGCSGMAAVPAGGVGELMNYLSKTTSERAFQI